MTEHSVSDLIRMAQQRDAKADASYFGMRNRRVAFEYRKEAREKLMNPKTSAEYLAEESGQPVEEFEPDGLEGGDE